MIMAFFAHAEKLIEHISTSSNTRGYATTINDPALNGRPNAVLIVTQVYGKYNPSEVAVRYSSGRWQICNQNRQTMPVGNKFNILVFQSSNQNVFVHTTSSRNTKKEKTSITYSKGSIMQPAESLGGVIIVTPQFNGNNSPLSVSTEDIKLHRSIGERRIHISNMNGASMPLNAKINILVAKRSVFKNVLILEGLREVREKDGTMHPINDRTYYKEVGHGRNKKKVVDRVVKIDKSMKLFTTPISIPHYYMKKNPYNKRMSSTRVKIEPNNNPTGVKLYNGKWHIFNQNRKSVPEKASFYVLAIKERPTCTVDENTEIRADVTAAYGTYGCNTCVTDVDETFKKASGSRHKRKSYQFAPTYGPLNGVAKPERYATNKVGITKDHVQGITRIPGLGYENYFAMTRNARKGIDGGLYIGKLDGIRSDGGSWAAARTQFSNRATRYSYHRLRGLNHGGGLQALGSMIFVAADCNEGQTCNAQIKIIDARQPERPKEINALVIDGKQNELSSSQTRTAAGKTINVHSNAAAVAAIRLQSGHYLVFIRGGASYGWFYISTTPGIGKYTKWKFLDFWHQDDLKRGAKWVSFENINFIADCEGYIYMVGMGTSDNTSALYRLTCTNGNIKSFLNNHSAKPRFNFEYISSRGLNTDAPGANVFDLAEGRIVRGLLGLIPISIGGFSFDQLHEAEALWGVTLRNGGGIHITPDKGLVSYATGRHSNGQPIQIDEFRYHGEPDRGRTQVASTVIPIKKSRTNKNSFSLDFSKVKVVKVSTGWAVTDGETQAAVLETREDAIKAIDIIKKHKGIK